MNLIEGIIDFRAHSKEDTQEEQTQAKMKTEAEDLRFRINLTFLF